MKNPMTPAGIEPEIFRFAAQHLNHCATAVPRTFEYLPLITTKTIRFASTNWVSSFSSAILLETSFVSMNFGTLRSRREENRSYSSCKVPTAAAAAVVIVTVTVIVSDFNQTYKCGHTSAKLMASFMEILSRVGELLHTDLQTGWQTHGEVQRRILTRSYLLTYLATPWCRAPLEKLTGLQLVKKFPAFHGTRKFITVLTSVRHLSLSWASPIQSIYPHPTSWRSILKLSTHLRLGLPSGLFPSDFPTKTLYTPLSSPICATCPAHLILLDFITRTIFGKEYRSLSSSLCNLLHSPVTSRDASLPSKQTN